MFNLKRSRETLTWRRMEWMDYIEIEAQSVLVAYSRLIRLIKIKMNFIQVWNPS